MDGRGPVKASGDSGGWGSVIKPLKTSGQKHVKQRRMPGSLYACRGVVR